MGCGHATHCRGRSPDRAMKRRSIDRCWSAGFAREQSRELLKQFLAAVRSPCEKRRERMSKQMRPTMHRGGQRAAWFLSADESRAGSWRVLPERPSCSSPSRQNTFFQKAMPRLFQASAELGRSFTCTTRPPKLRCGSTKGRGTLSVLFSSPSMFSEIKQQNHLLKLKLR